MRSPRDYTPIACELYSRYELIILRRERLLVTSRRGALHRVETLDPVDLRTRRHAEYLIARTPAGVSRVLRLDRISSSKVCPKS